MLFHCSSPPSLTSSPSASGADAYAAPAVAAKPVLVLVLAADVVAVFLLLWFVLLCSGFSIIRNDVAHLPPLLLTRF